MDDLQFYKDQYEDMRAEHDRLLDERISASWERRRESQRAARESECTATSWPDAFRTAIHRADCESGDPDVGDYFEKWTSDLKTSYGIYNQEMVYWNRVIAEIKAAALRQIARRIESEVGENELAEALLDNDWRYLVEW